MRKNILLLVSVLLLLGIGMAAFANSAFRTVSRTTMSCCCCHGDSCPMKNKDKASADAKSCCDNCDCCTGDSCPMKNKDKASADKTSADARSCCDNCDSCKGDSCPMKMKHDQKDGMTMPMPMDDKSGDTKSCDCPCCHDKDAKTDG